ncbi:MAG TPA: Hsp70 family protein [Candidatus Wujingus californicus]|uniref:Hsp70 family protein n=1 Tax=Candidatus Wujingus californicus TaxID=3367618 RepID=UPI001E03394F|nr:Hsp70 family protein [Planctomycetota bacterium]MDO8094670.1 Hsp70 family protein [Candidatus Brocadiales bacterium]MDO8130670.1 Hsp70 family protein [Candidatus Brocadiales bacterium]
MLNYWIGIDFGTYNSSAAIQSKQGNIEIIRSLGGKVVRKAPSVDQQEDFKEFPSFISFNKDGSINDIGINSKEKAYSEPEYVVWGIKRLLGKTYTELKESGELDRFPYRIRPDRTNGQCLIVVGEKSYTPVHLCSEIFKKIKSDAEQQVNGTIDSVVVSVPAYFDPLRVTPIVDAARGAGFQYIKTIPEPVAAALAYDIEITARPIKILVFDLGAGTLDVTAGCLYRLPDQLNEFGFRVEKNTGDPRLGGIDMDDRLLKLIMDKCQLSNVSPANMAILRRIAEIAKIRLSRDTRIEQEFQIDGQKYRCILDQLDLQSALEGKGLEKNLLEECRRQVMSAIDEAGWSTAEIEHVVIIGGPTRLPCIHDILKIVFHSNPAVLRQLEVFYSGKEAVDRMTAVCTGAVTSLIRKVDDKVPHGHGIETIEFSEEAKTYVPKILIPRDSPYPFKSEEHFLSWMTFSGLYDFRIIQQVPKSERQQTVYEYKFIGIQKFAVKDPDKCSVAFQMGYNANKELEVTIRNALSTESITYVGINQFSSVGMNYPRVEKTPPKPKEPKEGGTQSNGGSEKQIERKIKKIPPSPETLEKFIKWVQFTINFMQRKLDNQPKRQMLIAQIIDELALLLKKGDSVSQYEAIYTKVHGLIWNSSSSGLLTQNEFRDLNAALTAYENELFKVGLV